MVGRLIVLPPPPPLTGVLTVTVVWAVALPAKLVAVRV
jgi:hypothetical protein